MDTPTIPGYDILAPLPQGGMSAVFKARQVSLDRVVVLKILPLAMAVDGVDIEKLLAEAKITAQLKHPNIVQVYDFGKSPDGIYYFVMEFVSGYSVAEWIRRKTILSLKDTLLCAHYVAEALSYAWGTFGVVHCDIKPDNVMIDGDGTVKVADLGLARSVRSVISKAKFQAGVVVGTPYYISPEQSQGRRELDCRTDIYSLGAMLYHCLTGKMPFEGLPLLEIMDCQITDQIPDLVALQPHASMAVAGLIEKMMAKNPAHRQQDWPEVIRDMIRARAEILPQGPLPPEGASTMKRCVARAQRLKELEASAHPAREQKPSTSAPAATLPCFIARTGQWLKPKWLASVIVFLALAFACLFAVHMSNAPRSAAPPPDKRQTADDSLPAAALAKEDALARRRLAAALQWCQANPGRYNEAIRQLEMVGAQSLGTRHARAAADEIARIRERKRAALAADMKALQANVQPLLERQKWREAAALYAQYAGPFKAETEAERAAKVQEWTGRDQALQAEMHQAAEARKQEQSRQWQGLLNEIAARLVEGDCPAALAVVRQATNNIVLAANLNDLHALANMLAEAGRADQRLLDSFRPQKDQEVVIALAKGPERLVVRDVRDDTILVEKITIVSSGKIGQTKVIRLQDLSMDEKKARLGTNPTPDTALAHGLIALRDENWAAAETAWSQAGPLLAAPLMARLQERKNVQREARARSDFILLLRAAQVEAAEPLPGCEVCLAAIYQKKYPPQAAKVLAQSVADYQAQYARTEFAQAYAPALAALQQAPVIASDSNKLASLAAAPARARAGAADGASVRKELLERNPGLAEFNVSLVTDGAGKIVRAELVALDLKDIKPLAGLTDLRAVVCAVTRPNEWRESSAKALLSDLAPLKGLSLLEVCVAYTLVKDLSPLAGMPLQKLDLSGTRVTDFSVLKGMPLRRLNLSETSIRDLSPVRGIALEILNVRGTRVKDLDPLRDMPLKWLDVSDTDVRDLSPLRGVPLKSLSLCKTAVRDLAPIQDSPVEEIWLDYNADQQPMTDTCRAFLTVLLRMPRLRQVNGNSNFRERR